MKKFLLTILFLFFLCVVYSQQVVFTRDYNGSMLTLSQYTSFHVCDTTYNGNYLMGGGANSLVGSSYAYAITDQNGNPIWEKDSAVFGSLDIHDAFFTSGMRTFDNGFVFCGTLSNYGTSNASAVFILKTDTAGNELWRKSILQFQRGSAEAIYQSTDSSLFITGYVLDSVSNDFVQYLLKLSSAGDSLLMNIFPYKGFGESIFRIDDKLIICGTTATLDTTTQQTHFGYSIISTDTLGNLVSSYVINDSVYSVFVRSISKTIDNNILITCTRRDSTQQAGIVQLMKVDTAANVIWRDTVANAPYTDNASSVWIFRPM